MQIMTERSRNAKLPGGISGVLGNGSMPDFGTHRFMQGAVKKDDPARFYAREGVDSLTHAFDGKIAIHPGMGGTPVAAEEREAVLASVLGKERTGNSVAYIHVPFCETHCLYCGFFRSGYKTEQSRAYTDALLKELSFWRGLPAQERGPVHAVYLGGGTPTALEPNDLRRLIRGIRETLPLANDCEITVEGRSSNLTKERIDACFEGGANRFSLGVQSFHTHVRQAMGRRSTTEGLLERLSLLQSYNQAAVVVDLIYGFPLQTMDVWLEDIAIAQSLDLDGADCYQLNTLKNSLLARAVESGKLPVAADIPTQARMFEAGVAAMENGFYRRLSISHWGRTPRERNMYNQYIKGGAHCLAFGPGSGGSLHGHLYFSVPDYEQWLTAVQEGRKPLLTLQRPVANAALFKAMAGDMEQARLEIPRLERAFGLPLGKILHPLLDQWERAGLVRTHGESRVLTLAGQFWQVNLAQLLMEYCGLQFGKMAASGQ
jgi:Coproporphyrinogen III oxidase and related Fe-S oxidoreductases